MSTNVNSATESPAVFPTIIKRRSAVNEAPRAFSVDDASAAQQETKPAPDSVEPDKVISDAEKKYFANLFPADADAIQSYSPYQRNGMKRPASIGTLVDVKG